MLSSAPPCEEVGSDREGGPLLHLLPQADHATVAHNPADQPVTLEAVTGLLVLLCFIYILGILDLLVHADRRRR